MTASPNGIIGAKEPGRRKRGGQPGNTNAFKHGFYTKNFSLGERRGLHSKSALRAKQHPLQTSSSRPLGTFR